MDIFNVIAWVTFEVVKLNLYAQQSPHTNITLWINTSFTIQEITAYDRKLWMVQLSFWNRRNVLFLSQQFNDILLYTTPVQSGQYKVNSMLSLAGMKVRYPPSQCSLTHTHAPTLTGDVTCLCPTFLIGEQTQSGGLSEWVKHWECGTLLHTVCQVRNTHYVKKIAVVEWIIIHHNHPLITSAIKWIPGT